MSELFFNSVRRVKRIFSKHFWTLVNKKRFFFVYIVVFRVKSQHQRIKIVEMRLTSIWRIKFVVWRPFFYPPDFWPKNTLKGASFWTHSFHFFTHEIIFIFIKCKIKLIKVAVIRHSCVWFKLKITNPENELRRNESLHFSVRHGFWVERIRPNKMNYILWINKHNYNEKNRYGVFEHVTILFGCFLKYEYENCRSNKIWPLDKKVVQFMGHCLNN